MIYSLQRLAILLASKNYAHGNWTSATDKTVYKHGNSTHTFATHARSFIVVLTAILKITGLTAHKTLYSAHFQ
jgi:hypothetical protein